MMLEETGLSEQLRNLLWELRSKRSSGFSELVLSTQGSGLVSEHEFYYNLMEESYKDYKITACYQGYTEFYNSFTGRATFQ